MTDVFAIYSFCERDGMLFDILVLELVQGELTEKRIPDKDTSLYSCRGFNVLFSIYLIPD
ncbi:hypothetical protein SDC9_25187 [bioreactor metagenome]|uniref:Uncharacterized protein n=1 Tax=bioreactor metagenome TaxID=1076179 RepID=A0A644UK82_9ZZZZ